MRNAYQIQLISFPYPDPVGRKLQKFGKSVIDYLNT